MFLWIKWYIHICTIQYNIIKSIYYYYYLSVLLPFSPLVQFFSVMWDTYEFCWLLGLSVFSSSWVLETFDVTSSILFTSLFCSIDLFNCSSTGSIKHIQFNVMYIATCRYIILSSSSSIRYVTWPWIIVIIPGSQSSFPLKSFIYTVCSTLN